jgi:hypothetical protein
MQKTVRLKAHERDRDRRVVVGIARVLWREGA